jgi:hypothetical protein
MSRKKCRLHSGDGASLRSGGMLVWLVLGSLAVAQAAPLRLAVGNVPKSAANWNVGTLTVANLSGPAGSNLVSSFQSVPAQVLLNLRASPLGTWKVSVQRADVAWSSILHLFIRRTGSGAGTGTVAGGLAYQEVTTAAVQLLTGTLNVNNIPLQLRLDGVSVVMGPGAYSTRVVYTATEP